jgi:hypothetical protein
MSMTMKPQAVVAETSGIGGFHIVPSLVTAATIVADAGVDKP